MSNPVQSLRAIGKRLFGGDGTVAVTATRTVSTPGFARLPAIKREPAKTVAREAEPCWKTWGWKRNGNVYSGYFRALGLKRRGEIHERPGGGFDTYIWDPPDWVLNGGHGRCFRLHGEGRFFVHQLPEPESVDHAIRSVELVLIGRE